VHCSIEAGAVVFLFSAVPAMLIASINKAWVTGPVELDCIQLLAPCMTAA
jgi:hypothetical protein